MELSHLDRLILDLLQNRFPICVQPYRQMAGQLNIDENSLLERIAFLQGHGIIRRIGGIMDSRSLGFYSLLCAAQVPEDRIDQVADLVSAEPGVTHNYLRDHDLNLWFTLTAPTPDDVQTILQRLEEAAGIKIYAMPAEKTYKIRLSLPMQEAEDAD